jgi:hypothetical protein
MAAIIGEYIDPAIGWNVEPTEESLSAFYELCHDTLIEHGFTFAPMWRHIFMWSPGQGHG